MKAIVYKKYGPPDVLQLEEVQKPSLKSNQILVKIIATTVTKGDVLSRSMDVPAKYKLPMRLMMGVFSPRRKILGHEFSGEVEAVGSSVKKFKKGDQVYGSTGFNSGTYAEYICLSEKGIVAQKPASMSHEEAATVPVGGNTALNILKKANINDGDKVLIHGASGSVGINAVQIAKYYGAEVTGVCSTDNVKMVKSLGADKVIDYTKEDFTKGDKTYDVIIDAVNLLTVSKCRKSMAKGGRFVAAKTMAPETADNLNVLSQLIEEKELKTVIDRTYRLDEIVDAHRYVDLGHKKGNVAIDIKVGLMKAMVYKKYGSVDQLKLAEVEKPIAVKDQVLIKVKAASVNNWDWDRLTGKPFLYRFISGFVKPKLQILGADVAGIVEAVGDEVSKFKPGDEVYGDVSREGWGGFAEYTSVSEKALTKKPKKMSFEEAAAIPQAGVMALQSLTEIRTVKKKDKVLINGAAGGIGTFAIQIAKMHGAEVTAVDRTEKMDFLRSLGAVHVVDYKKENYTKSDEQYDRIVDVVANQSNKDYQRALNKDGIFFLIGGKVGSAMKVGLFGSRYGKKENKKIKILAHEPNKDLEQFNTWFEKGKVKPVIDKVFPLEKTGEALQYIGDGNVMGKVIVKIDAN